MSSTTLALESKYLTKNPKFDIYLSLKIPKSSTNGMTIDKLYFYKKNRKK